MNRLILHVGMPKTGSSSIQQSLYYRLEDPRFHYLGFGLVNGSRALQTLFSIRTGDYLNELLGLDSRQLNAVQHRLRCRLMTGLNRCRERQATPILSAEWCWGMTTTELTLLRDTVAERGFEPEVLVYLRPLPAWYPSGFQESIKWGGTSFRPFQLWDETMAGIDESDFAAGLDRLDAVFGRSHVCAVPFEKTQLKNGCIVQDFCQRLGIDLPAKSIIRANESHSLDATRLLYTYYSRGPGFGNGRRAIEENLLLHGQLSSLQGPPFRYHPTLLAERADHIARQHAAVETRLGMDFGRGAPAHDEGFGVRDESDLFRHRPESLQWLARVTGLPCPAETEGEGCDRQVVAMVDHLRRHASLTRRLSRIAELVHREWRRWTRGV